MRFMRLAVPILTLSGLAIGAPAFGSAASYTVKVADPAPAPLPGAALPVTGTPSSGLSCGGAPYELLMNYVDLSGVATAATVSTGNAAADGTVNVAAAQIPSDAAPGDAALVLAVSCSSGTVYGGTGFAVASFPGDLSLSPPVVPLGAILTVRLTNCRGGPPTGELDGVDHSGQFKVGDIAWQPIAADASVVGTVRTDTNPWGLTGYAVKVSCPQTYYDTYSRQNEVHHASIDRPGVFRAGTFFFRVDSYTLSQKVFPVVSGIPLWGRFAGDRPSSAVVFRPAAREVYAYDGAAAKVFQVTAPRDATPIPVGDVVGDTLNFYDRATSIFYIGFTRYGFGRVGDVPLAGDWNGDGQDEIGVYRPTTRTFYLAMKMPRRGVPTPVQAITFGRVGDRPVVGDWNGDARDSIGVVRGSVWYLTNDNHNVATRTGFGRSTDQLVVWRYPYRPDVVF